jgi:nucleoside-diphosphate-sugar epimerase
MSYILLTGSTGFLGRYVLRDCLTADLPMAVMVRAGKRETARQRVEAVMRHWEGQLGRAMPRPVVLQGDVREPGCGLSEADRQWLARHCDTIVHSAASMNFHASQPDGEPYHSNVQGTKHLLAMCEAAGIRHFHQVSTAYICGLRQGRVLESELDLGQTNGNDYERSKMAAEKLIRQAPFLASATFYRPASVIGDSQSGYTTNYHGFYAPLQVLYSMAKGLLGLGDVGRQIIADVTKQARFMDRLNLKGDEGKNLVPVDWVSAVLVHVLRRPELHGETYHLTPRERTTVQMVYDVFDIVLREYAGIADESQLPPIEVPQAERESTERIFREQMTTYDSHWRDDPIFDYANTQRAAPHLPCPIADREMLLRTSRYAVNGNFGWPKPQPVTLSFDAAARLARLTQRAQSANASGNRVALQVTGPGGGAWSVALDGTAPAAAEAGIAPDCIATYHLNSQTLSALMDKQITVDQAVYAGAVVIEGAASDSAIPILQEVVAV